MSELNELVKKRTHELNHLLEGLGTDFPVVEDNKRRRIAYLEMLIEDLSSLKPFQPPLNDNQQQVLGWLKVGHCEGDSIFEALERITCVYEDPKTEEALELLSPYQEVQVINSFMNWVLEQEEEHE